MEITKESLQPSRMSKKIYIVFLILILVIIILGIFSYTQSISIQKLTKDLDKLNKELDTTHLALQKEYSQSTKKEEETTSPVVEPVYTDNDYVVFAHYALGYTVEYPAKLTDLKLVGATGGNFMQESSDGSTLLIYDLYQEKPDSGINIDNLTQLLTECNEGGCRNFFDNNRETYEKIIEKKVVLLGKESVFWVKSKITENTSEDKTNKNADSETIERFFVPSKDNLFLVAELRYKDKIPTDLFKTLYSFKLISNIPSSWNEYPSNQDSKIKFKYPNGFSISENKEKKQIDINSTKGLITINYYDNESEISEYFDYKDRPFLDLNSVYSAEKYLCNDVPNLKFSLNAFTYLQGGDVSIRVFNSDKNQVSVYFDTPLSVSNMFFKITAPKDMEMLMNQILMSVQELMR